MTREFVSYLMEIRGDKLQRRFVEHGGKSYGMDIMAIHPDGSRSFVTWFPPGERDWQRAATAYTREADKRGQSIDITV